MCKLTEEKYGIDETLEVVEAAVSFANAIDDATSDGWQWLVDPLKFVAPVTKLPAAIGGITNVPTELSDVSDADRIKISEKIQEMNFKQEYAEKIGEQALRFATEFASLVLLINEAKK